MALLATPDTGRWIVAAVIIAAAAGGMLWAAITALLRDRFHAHEILVSLMLVYVAQLLLSYMVHGPLKDPAGFGFPQSPLIESAARLPILIEGTRLHLGFALALLAAAIAWLVLARSVIGLQLRVAGLAPQSGALCRLLGAACVVDGCSRLPAPWPASPAAPRSLARSAS